MITPDVILCAMKRVHSYVFMYGLQNYVRGGNTSLAFHGCWAMLVFPRKFFAKSDVSGMP